MSVNTEPFEPPRHIVAVGGLVVHPRSGDVLLLRSPRRDWEFPGGQVEENESLTEALGREIREETGVTVSVGPLVGVYSNIRSGIVMFGFVCEWISGEPTTSPESLEVEWISPEEAQRRVTRPPLRDRLRDMLEFRGKIVYRAYSFSARGETGDTEYAIHEERLI